MTAESMWKEFTSKFNTENAPHEAWSYGGGAVDKLLELTMCGKKTATASSYAIYRYENCDIPAVGSYSVILNSKNEAGCIIKTTRVSVVPFDKVTPEHAAKEGEGDLSLAYWRDVHKEFFSMELAEINESFTENMDVVCEEFELVYKPGMPA